MIKRLILCVLIAITIVTTTIVVKNNRIHHAISVDISINDLTNLTTSSITDPIVLTNTGCMNVYLQTTISITGDKDCYSLITNKKWHLVSNTIKSHQQTYIYQYASSLQVEETTSPILEVQLIDEGKITLNVSIQAIESRFFKNPTDAFTYY